MIVTGGDYYGKHVDFASEKEVRFGKLLKFIIPTYLTSLFNTVYTIESIKDSDPTRCNRYNDSRVQNLCTLVALGYACRDRERAVHLLYSGRRFSYIQFCNSTVRRHFEHCS